MRSLRPRGKTVALLAIVACIVATSVMWDRTGPKIPVEAEKEDAIVIHLPGKTIAPPVLEQETAENTAGRVAAALREWDDNDDPDLRDERLAELDEFLRTHDALTVLRALPSELRNFALAAPAFREWAAGHPRDAAGWLGSLDEIPEARVWTLVADWHARDPQDLQSYLGALPDGEWKQAVTSAACNQVFVEDPLQAIAWAIQIQPGPRQTGILELASAEWARADGDSARRWVGEIKDPQLEERLWAAMANANTAEAPH